MSCDHTVALGAYLLGSLDPAERSAFERHLRTCGICRREMLRLAPLPGLLSQVRLEDLELPFEDPAPDPDLVPLPQPEPEPEPVAVKRRRPVLAGAGALVVVLVAVAVLFLRPAADDRTTWQAVDGTTGVAAQADLTAKSWGTELWLSLQHIPPGQRCKLMVYNRSGKSEVGGWWGTDHPDDERIPGSTSFRRDQIDRLDIVVDQKVLVSLRP